MPFIAIASNVDVIQENYLLRAIYAYFNFTSTIGFLIFIGCSIVYLHFPGIEISVGIFTAESILTYRV